MGKRTNPFEELYVSETVPPHSFVRLFSPFLVRHALPLFQSGNVVLRGTQGSGKTTLLSLLQPEIRVAYADANLSFPVPEEHSRFIACGINLRRSGATNFGQRPFSADTDRDAELLPLYFADFVNYWLVSSILDSIITYRDKAGGRIGAELEIDASGSRLDMFAVALAADPVWFGALPGIESFRSLQVAIEARLRDYLRFLNFNQDDLPAAINRSKTLPGQPISCAARILRDVGVLLPDVNVFVRVDQYEELGSLAHLREGHAKALEGVVNRAVGMRDGHVSFRVGTRRYAWSDAPAMHGTAAVLQREREYTVVDLDELLKRKENVRTYIFPGFAADVMRRRLQVAGYDLVSGRSPLIARVFGRRPSPSDRASMYVSENRGCGPDRIVDGTGLSESWLGFLSKLAARDPFHAKLAEAWARQGGGERQRTNPPAPDASNKHPWEREYWKKERRDQALMQLAATCVQRLQWSSNDDIIALSGANILVFVSICRQVWAAHIRASDDEPEETLGGELQLPQIDYRVQSIGIEEASRQAYESVPELRGHERQRFINHIGRLFRTRLLKDRAMSYPGHNGFSLAIPELEQYPELRDFLQRAVDYGDLVESQHTTKEKDRRTRLKWYLKPILSPFFSIPVTHVKEPLYVTPDIVEGWRRDANGDGRPSRDGFVDTSQDAQLAFLEE